VSKRTNTRMASRDSGRVFSAIAFMVSSLALEGGGCRPEPMRSGEVARSSAVTQAAADEQDGTATAIPASPPSMALLPTVPEDPVEEPTKVVPPREPQEVQNVLILGDSLAATGFGALLQKRLDAHPMVRCFRTAKSASGLARPDFFDWMTEGKKQVALRRPDLVVVIMGGNDGQDLMSVRSNGKRVAWDTDGWKDAYRQRMQTFLQIVTAPERQIVWLGLPRMGLRSLERKLELIRSIQQDAVREIAERGHYLDTTAFLVDAAGALRVSGKLQGRAGMQRLREDDGIHFTMAGSQYLADHVYPEILAILGLSPSWRRDDVIADDAATISRDPTPTLSTR